MERWNGPRQCNFWKCFWFSTWHLDWKTIPTPLITTIWIDTPYETVPILFCMKISFSFFLKFGLFFFIFMLFFCFFLQLYFSLFFSIFIYYIFGGIFLHFFIFMFIFFIFIFSSYFLFFLFCVLSFWSKQTLARRYCRSGNCWIIMMLQFSHTACTRSWLLSNQHLFKTSHLTVRAEIFVPILQTIRPTSPRSRHT